MAWDPAPGSPPGAAAAAAAATGAEATTVTGRESTGGKAQAYRMAAWWRISGAGEGATDAEGAWGLLGGLVHEAVRPLTASPVAQRHAEPSARASQEGGAPLGGAEGVPSCSGHPCAGRRPPRPCQRRALPIRALLALAVALCSLQVTLAMPLGEPSTILSEGQRLRAGRGTLRGDWHPSGESVQPQRCKNTLQGKILVSDDRGYTCKRWDLNFQTGCCNKGNSSQSVRLRGSTGKSLLVFPRAQVLPLSADDPPPLLSRRFSCATCNLTSGCCTSYEYCVSCCLSPDRTSARLALGTPQAHQASAAPFGSVFDFCTNQCRHNSQSVVHENAYISDLHHCFRPPSALGPEASIEHLGHTVRVSVAPQGVSCDDTCAKISMRCDPGYLPLLNNCTVMRQHLACRSGCVSSSGTDQPAEVVDLASPRHRPGVCLLNTNPGLFSCSGFHENTRRLCPCKYF